MNDNIKKYWFVALIALALIVGIGYFSIDQINSAFHGKRVKGQYVVSELADDVYFATDYYKDLFESNVADGELYKLFERGVLSSIETSSEVKEQAKKDAAETKKGYAQQYGQEGLDSLDTQLRGLGYKGLDDFNIYFEDIEKKKEMIRSFATANYDTEVKEYFETKKPRTVSHILIKMADSANPTEAELAKVAEVEAALKGEKSFGEIALELSEDEASATKRGSLGLMDADTQFVKEFLESALSLNQGQRSEWVTTTHGKHLIEVDSTDFETLLKEDSFIDSLLAFNNGVLYKSIWNHAQTLDMKFSTPELEQRIKTFMGV